MQATRAVDAHLLERGTPHSARSFTGLPDPDAAVRLLDKIAGRFAQNLGEVFAWLAGVGRDDFAILVLEMGQ